MELSYRQAANIKLDPAGEKEYPADSEFDSKELKEGVKDEYSEHSNPNISWRENQEIAKQIAKDHLEKNPQYYSDIAEAEKSGK